MAASSTPPGWTDHNTHDPSVTLLQALVYTIGAVALVSLTAATVRSRRRKGARIFD